MSNKTVSKVFISFLTGGLAVAMAAGSTYKIELLQDSTINGHQLKAGSYKLALENNTAVLKHGKETVEVPAHSESAPDKFSNTTMRYADNNTLQEIHIGGTNTKIVFGPATNGASGGSF
jgi:hypothetical protein